MSTGPLSLVAEHRSCCPEDPVIASNPLGGDMGRIGRATRILALVAVLGSAVSPAFAFTLSQTVVHREINTALQASKKATHQVQPVQPRSSIPAKERQEAVKAMDLHRSDATLMGVDAQMLELLSDQFLYPTVQQGRGRPRGRPECVPGAMKYETMLKLRERAEVMDLEIDKQFSTVVPYTSTNGASNDVETKKPVKKEGKQIKKTEKRTAKGESKVEDPTSSVKKRKKVVKNLPEPRERPAEEYGSAVNLSKLTKRKKGADVDLQKYYKTELLSADEEYSLGMKVQFMMRCEEVHEGLSIQLMRLPTMREWAEACGYTVPDSTFMQTEADDQLRPAGADALFEELDPNMFVGNGLATDVGPGRGRGRVKKPPPVKLLDYYDNSEERSKNRRNSDDTLKQNIGTLVNRGTATDFVEAMFTAREAKQRMVQSNMRLVVSIARKYSNVGVNLQDLVQEGSLGLTRAAEKFEPEKGFKFSTYASWWIQQAVFRSIAYHSRTIRLPVHVHNLLNRVRRIRMTLEQDLGRAPTNEEMARQLDMSTEKYDKMVRLTRRSISLELPKYQSNPKDLGHESEDLLVDTIANSVIHDESSAEKRVDRGLLHEDLKEMLTVLDEDERNVICSRYGITDGLTRTVTAVASQMKQSKAWVRSQECRALRKLRRPWYEKRLKEHQDSLIS